MEMRCYRRILRTSYKDHVTNEEVRAKIQQALGPREGLVNVVQRRKLKCYGHVSHSSGLSKTILQGTAEGGRDKADRKEVGRQHQGMDRPGVNQVQEGGGEQRKMEEIGCEVISLVPQRPLLVKG